MNNPLVEQLIEALQIFDKYFEPGKKTYFSHCEHDELTIVFTV